MERADCHCHTLYSDGSYSVRDLLDLAKSAALSGLSITDHDTIAAYPEAFLIAQALGITLIPGIEISAIHARSNIHVLGYAFQIDHPELLAFCEQQQKERFARNEQILDRLSAIKMPITMKELMARFGQGTQGRPHIAQLMVEKGYVKSIKEAFERYLGERKRCYVAGFEVSVEQAIAIIHRVGGFAVLAHPHFITPKRIISSLTDLHFDGIEAYYGALSLAQEKPWIDLAKKKNWFITGGSDFHGNKKAYAKLGSSFTPPETFAILVERTRRHALRAPSP